MTIAQTTGKKLMYTIVKFLHWILSSIIVFQQYLSSICDECNEFYKNNQKKIISNDTIMLKKKPCLFNPKESKKQGR